MANFAISDMAPATLPIDINTTFLELETIEGGIRVSRKIAAVNLGLGGGVLSVVGGVNIDVDATDPVNPIVNMPAALAGISVNGVTLQTGGAVTDFLNATGGYSAPPSGGGQVDSVVGGTNISVNVADPVNPIVNLDAAITGVSVDGVTLNAAGVATNYLDETGAYSVPAGSGGIAPGTVTNATPRWSGAAWIENTSVLNQTNGRLDLIGSPALLRLDAPGAALDETTTDLRMENFSGFVIQAIDDGGFNGPALMAANRTGTAWQNLIVQTDLETSGVNDILAGGSVYIEQKAAAAANRVDKGQFWVRDDAAQTPMFTDDAGLDSVLNGGGSIPDPLILGSINLTSSQSVATTGAPYNDVAINIGANLVGTQGMTRYGRQNIQTMPSGFGFNSTLFININGTGTAGSDTIIGGLNSAQIEIEFGVAVRFQHGLVSTVVAETASAAAGGFLANNLATGAGLERVLTTSDLGGGGSPFLTPLNVTTAGNVAIGGLQTATVGITRLDATPLADWGFFGAQELELKSYNNGGRFVMKLNDTAGVERQLVVIDPDTGFFLTAMNTFSLTMWDGTTFRTAISAVHTGSNGVDLRANGVITARVTNGSAGGLLVVNQVTSGASLERVLTIADLGSGAGAVNQTVANTITWASASGSTRSYASGAIARYASGADIRFDDNANLKFGTGDDFSFFFNAVNMEIQGPGGGAIMLVTAIDQFRVSGSLGILEAAAPDGNVAGVGQWWVRSSAPCRPTFTDDTDVDQLLDPSISEIVSVVASRTLVMEDKGKTIGFTGGTVAQTMTIPASGAVAYQIGTLLGFDNSGSVSHDIAITTDTLIFADDNSTGTRTLGPGGAAVAQKVGATTWKISGAQLT